MSTSEQNCQEDNENQCAERNVQDITNNERKQRFSINKVLKELENTGNDKLKQ